MVTVLPTTLVTLLLTTSVGIANNIGDSIANNIGHIIFDNVGHSMHSNDVRFLIVTFLFIAEAFEYLTLELNRVPGQGLGLSIVGRR